MLSSLSATEVAFVMAAVMQAVLAIVWVLGAWAVGDTRRAALHWATYAALSAVSFTLLTTALRSAEPQPAEGLRAAGNLVGVIALMALQRGVWLFIGRMPTYRFHLIALALVLKPSLLIADEPTTSLDVIVESQILEILQDLKRVYHMSLQLITHSMGIVAEICDRVAVLYAGKLVELGSAHDVFHKPLHPYTQGLLASIIHLDTKELHSIEGSPPDLISPPSGCRFHPRCPYAQQICVEKEPPLVEFQKGHLAACHFGDTFL